MSEEKETESLLLFPFQKKGIKRMVRAGLRNLLADEMGLGKTPQSLRASWMYLDRGPYLIICPKTIKDNWEDEIRKWIGTNKIVRLSGRVPPLNFAAEKDTYYIINYDVVRSRQIGAVGTWANILSKQKFQVVIIDEGHYLGNYKSQQTRNITWLCRHVKHILILTGTPTTDKPFKLWPLVNILWPDLFPNMTRFGNRYCRPRWTPFGKVYDGAARLKELHRILKGAGMIRRTKKQVLPELPAKTRIFFPIELSDINTYREAEKDFVHWLMKTNPEKHAQQKWRKTERLARYTGLISLIADLKMKALKEWIDDFLEESYSKMIVFGTNVKVVKVLNETYSDVSVRVDGSITGEHRKESIRRFQKDDDCRLIFCNYRAGGVGWNGQVADVVMMAQMIVNPGIISQAEDRAHRIGQKSNVSVFFLVGKDTLEERMVPIMKKAQKVLDQVLDGVNARTDIDILDAIEDMLLEQGE